MKFRSRYFCYSLLAIIVLGVASCGIKRVVSTNNNKKNDLRKTYEALVREVPEGDVLLDGDRIIVTLSEALLFKANSDIINSSSYPSLNKLASTLNRYPKTSMVISGYTDNRGTDKNNQDLSRRRAEAAKSYLVKNQVSPSRIYTWGLGSKNPVASNDTEEGRARNRRVQFVIIQNYNASISNP